MIKVCWFNREGVLRMQVTDTMVSKGIHVKVTEFYNNSEDGDLLVLYNDNRLEVTWKNNGGYVSMVE